MSNNVSIRDVIQRRNALALKEKQLYLTAAENINSRLNDLLKEEDFGTTLVSNLGHDVAGEVVRRYFDFGNYYITVDQMYDRIVHFTYENENDVLATNEGVRKLVYNYSEEHSAEVKEIADICENAQQKLFTEERSKDKLEKKGIKEFKEQKRKESPDGKLHDDFTGEEEDFSKRTGKYGQEHEVSDLQADHVQAKNSATYNSRYIKKEKIENLKKFYNSADNFQMMHASANASKSDIRVCEVNVCDKNGNIQYDELGRPKKQKVYLTRDEIEEYKKNKNTDVKDVTHKATPEELAEATVAAWEKDTKTGNKKQKLKEKGYLDKNGKVKPEVKRKLIEKARQSQNAESWEILKATDYKVVGKDALRQTTMSMQKILVGQIIYYVMPPVVYEARQIVTHKDMTIDKALKELPKSSKRVFKYVKEKLKDILKNIFGNSFDRLLKSFFEIIIEMLKATVKRMFKIVKDLVLSLVNCGKILLDKKATGAQKAEAITKIIAVTITTIIVDLLFDQVAKFLPPIFAEPLQVIVTLLATNFVMLILQKLDLFDVRYGFLVSNIEKIFDEEIASFQQESDSLITGEIQLMENEMNNIVEQAKDINDSIREIDVYHEDVTPYLQQFSNMFNMNIDFNREWEDFVMP